MIRVLVLGPDVNSDSICGGQITHVKNIVNAFSDEQGIEVNSFSSSNGAYNQESLLTKILRQFRVVFWLFINAKKYDVFHINSTFDNRSFLRDGLISFILAVRRRNFFIQFHGGDINNVSMLKKPVFKKIFRRLLSLSTKVLVLTDSQKRSIFSVLECESSLIYNFLDYEPVANKRYVGDEISFLFLSRVDKKKGIFELIEAFHKLEGNLKLKIAGTGPDLENVMCRVEQLGMTDKVIFLGFINGKDKASVYQSSDFFILPSYEEAFPYSILEAQSFGMPVIATRVGAVDRIISQGINGYLLDSPNEENIQQAMTRVIDELGGYSVLSSNAYKNSLRFSKDAMKKNFAKLWGHE